MKYESAYSITIKPMYKETRKNARPLTKKNVKAFLVPLRAKGLRIHPRNHCVAFVDFATEAQMKQALVKDKSFIDGLRVIVKEHVKLDNTNSSATSEQKAPWSEAEDRLKSAEPVAESGRLFVRNLYYQTTEEDLQSLFEKNGPVTEIDFPTCKDTGKKKGYATITFLFPEHAVKAMNELDGTTFKGRILHILPYFPHKDESERKKPADEKKETKTNKPTWRNWANWNTLFISSSAVVDAMCKKYGKTKSEILSNKDGESAAVNLALGETAIVNETKRFLNENGVSLDAFSDPNTDRSNTIILVKNLPMETEARELKEVFEKHGQVDQVILPPHGMSAIISFRNVDEAKAAFKKIAYTRYKYLPLYLEWAPVNTLSHPPKVSAAPSWEEEPHEAGKLETPAIEDSQGQAEAAAADADAHAGPPEEDTTIYVKDINFSTDEETLKTHFSKCGLVRSVTIALRRGLSQGYGFVQFQKKSDSKKALQSLNGSQLDGHSLLLQRSDKNLSTQTPARSMAPSSEQKPSRTLLVKNIPFQATRKEIKQLFKTFGGLKEVRLQSKKENKEELRGFGFAEFFTKEDAVRAFEALSLSSHLYGRRLVLEWANEDESVEEMRQKTAKRFLDGKNASVSKKKKIKMDDGDKFEQR